MNYKKRIALFAMLIILAGGMLPSFISNATGEVTAKDIANVSSTTGAGATKEITKKNDNFQVEVEYGIDGYIIWEHPTVARVTVKSNQNFTGTLVVKPISNDMSYKSVAYAEDITLAAGEAKTFTLAINGIDSLQRVGLSILNENEKVIYSEEEKLNVDSSGQKVMVGVLSDDYSALNYFDGLPFQTNNFTGVSSTLELTKDSLVADSSVLSVLNYIIIDNFDTANLSDKQYATLKEWVNNGGILVLSLGANYQNVLHLFSDDFISGTLGNLEKKEIKWGESVLGTETTDAESTEKIVEEPIEETTEITEDNLCLESVDSVNFEMKDSEELSTFSDNQTAYRKNIGEGVVVVLSYALGMEPISSFAEKDAVATRLLYETKTPRLEQILDGVTPNDGNLGAGLELAGYANSSMKPSALLYGLLLFFYVAFVGPILYLILKKVKKREKIWIAIPATALIFTGIIYLTGFLYRVKVPLANTCTVIGVDDTMKNEMVYTNLVCPKADRYHIGVTNGYSNLRQETYDYNYSWFGTSSKKIEYMLKNKADGLEMVMDCSEAFSEADFMVSKTSENDFGSLDYDIKCYMTGFEGTITNNTNSDLEEVVVSFESFYYRAGDIKRGETVTIDKNKVFEGNNYYGLFDNIFSKEYKDFYYNNHLRMLAQIDTTMVTRFADVRDYGRGYVWAYVPEYKPEFLEKSKIRQNGYGIYFESFTGEYSDVTGLYTQSLEPMIVSGGESYDQSYDKGLMYSSEVEITYSFEYFPGVTELENVYFGQKSPVGSSDSYYADVYAYNPQTGGYEQLFADSATISFEELKKYMNGDVLILSYRSPNADYYNTYVPRILVRGGQN